jgi:spermidine synthase
MTLRSRIIWSIVGAGISSVATQLVTVREILTQFHGNEITISLVLFCWLLLTGLGSLATRLPLRPSLTLYGLLTLLMAFGPLGTLIAIRTLMQTVFTHGLSPGFYATLLFITVVMTPYCLLTGFVLPYAQKVLHAYEVGYESAELYFTDSAGDILGGALFSFVLVYWFHPFAIVAATSSCLIFASLWILAGDRRRVWIFAAVAASAVFYVVALDGKTERSTLQGQYGDLERYIESPYGRVVVSKAGPQRTFWESGLPLYSDQNVVESEEKVHYALCQLDHLKNILLISGGLGETITEISKYGPKRIEYVELDPQLTRTALELGVLKETPALTIINEDGRQFIKTASEKYDAVIVDLPDPDTFQLNRFFTEEFFSQARAILKDGGILSFGVEYSPNFISETRKEKLAILFNTARTQFSNVVVIPGESAYFLCRNGPLTLDVVDRLKAKGVQTAYVEGFYTGNVTEDRLKLLRESTAASSLVNRDFEPRLMAVVLKDWFQKYRTSPKIFVVGVLIFLVGYGLFLKREEYVLFSTGLAGMGAEMIVVFAFQVLYGYVYLQIGAIVTAFLLGLFPGALAAHRFRGRESLKLGSSEIILTFLLIVVFGWVSFLKNEPPPLLFLVFCFVFAFWCGFQFPLAARLIGEAKSPAAGCLAADLTGAALGTLLMGAWVIPVWGMQAASGLLIFVKTSSMMLLFFNWRGLKR